MSRVVRPPNPVSYTADRNCEDFKIPHAEDGNTIGLFGGSFNPPHQGHYMVAETALKRLGLDQVWWMVSPGNPLKDNRKLADVKVRVANTKALASHPKMKVRAFEAALGSPYSAHTIARLKQMRPRLNFVWVMGADNLASFHHWQDWRAILESVPVAVVNRPKATLSPLSAPMSITYRSARWRECDAPQIKYAVAPAWVFLHGPLDATSSTSLRGNA
ncbi:nicotinate-nucleotide adenylyltransferase [Rhodobacteraceae bacterium RKSG542]|uniref:nicotinate-nucleotide adenylyltransferase n=1 Tax=Pseudovibrio flavus TaxID=2529854 RepID=UPI0012BBF8CE|nr:nicotinate-nucleotide adenylyltransferase [Pseudovibrio flavus]